MDELGPDELYLFVVDTDRYAGNFEREMCAYMTGIVGEAEVGEEAAEDYQKTFNIVAEEFNEHILQLGGEHGYTPVGLLMTPRTTKEHVRLDAKEGACRSIAIFMDRIPTAAEVDRMKARANEFINDSSFGKPDKIKIAGFRLISRIVEENELEMPT